MGNYRQLGVPLLFPRKVSVYLLAGFIDIFLFWTLFLLHFFHIILQRKKTFVASGGDVSFTGCYGDEKADYRGGVGRGKWAAGLEGAPGPARGDCEAEGAGLGTLEEVEVGRDGGESGRRPRGADSSEGSQELGVASLPAISMCSVNILLPSFLRLCKLCCLKD